MTDQWTTPQVEDWLKKNGLEKFALLFGQHKIDGKILLVLTESDLKDPPMSIETLGDIKRLYLAIRALQHEHTLKTLPEPINCDNKLISQDSIKHIDSLSFSREVVSQGQIYEELHPERWKLALSLLYAGAGFFLVTLGMVIANDNVDIKYAPLPDLILDNVPRSALAIELSEYVISTLCTIMIIVVILHKHRFIIIRRYFTIMGTVYLLRALTVVLTALPIPFKHGCVEKSKRDLVSRMLGAVRILRTFGMSTSICGDYMFSGHASSMVVSNYFITECEYGDLHWWKGFTDLSKSDTNDKDGWVTECLTSGLMPLKLQSNDTPRRLVYLHAFTWVLVWVGMFLILVSHEHYSIDVFIAFYISSRLFLYYHTFANNQRSASEINLKTRINFPLFAYFESKCCGVVLNEYEWPFPYPKSFKQFFKSEQKQDEWKIV